VRHVFKVEDGGGDRHWYSAETGEEAKSQHYGDCGMACGCKPEDEPCDVSQLPDDANLTIRHENGDVETKSAGAWAGTTTGLIGSTVY
jgi:hypothetical protein